jgi:hypothetical protein
MVWLVGRSAENDRPIPTSIARTAKRVYQLTALVTKLPPWIKDFMDGLEDPAVLHFFTERRPRPLTMISDGEMQMAQFSDAERHGHGCPGRLQVSEKRFTVGFDPIAGRDAVL